MNDENLKPFKKGQSGNPEGRPKGALSWKTTFKKWLTMETDEFNPITKLTERMNQYDKITLATLTKARNGDIKAAEFFKDHMESKPKQGIDLSNTDGTLSKEIVFKRYKKEK